MGNGMGELGFWLAVGMVVAAVIVAGAIKERDRQAALRAASAAVPERERERQELLRALLEKGGDNTTEVLAYLRERDAARAARAEAMNRANPMLDRKRMSPRQQMAFLGAFLTGIFSFMGGFFAPIFLSRPNIARLVYSPQAGRMIPQYPPTPTGLDALLPIGVMLGIWAAGLVVAVLFLMWGGFGKQSHDAQPGG